MEGVSDGVCLNDVGRERPFDVLAFSFPPDPEADDDGRVGGGVGLPLNREKSDFMVV
jgi:hypothetical protein